MIENYLDKIKQRLNVVVLHAVIYTRYSSDNADEVNLLTHK